MGVAAPDAGSATQAQAAAAPVAQKGIVLYCDLAVDPSREAEMLKHFHEVFRPGAAKFAGYRDLKMLKFNSLIEGGPGPAPGVNYRFQLTYESEALRQAWIGSPEHAVLWLPIQNAVLDKGYPVTLYDEA
jgi:hypothetical protein